MTNVAKPRDDSEVAANAAAIALLRSAVENLTPATYDKFAGDAEPSQEIIRLAHFIRDIITEHQQAVHELTIQRLHSNSLSSELETFKLAVENAADYIFIMDESLRIIYANKAALIGMELKDAIGKTIVEAFLPPGTAAAADPLYEHLKKGDKQFVTEATLPGPNGIPAIFQTMTTVTHDTEGRKLIISIGRNVTKERALERDKDEFVAIASHELRTPMTAIRGYISLLERERLGPLNDEQKAILEKMSRNAKSLIQFVGNMLDLSKLEAKKLEMKPEDSALESLIKTSMDKIRILYDGKGITLSYDGAPAHIFTDPLQFDRIVSNLLGNAYKFTPDGGKVTIRSAIDQATGLATICISDTGVGIPKTAIEGLFKRFAQVGDVLQRQSEGTGLGLAICKDLVEALGGTIWVKSTPGQGSEFYFTMPLSAAPHN